MVTLDADSSPQQGHRLPSEQQVAQHLQDHPLRTASRLIGMLPLIILIGVLLVALTVQHPLAAVLPWFALAGVLITAHVRVRRLRHRQSQFQIVQELSLQRRHQQALDLAWQLLAAATNSPQMHGHTVALIAHSLDQLKAYDAAIVAYSSLIDQLPQQHPGSVQLQIQRAMAQLQADHLADADDALRRLRHSIEAFANTVVSAGYRLAQLIQQVRTNHFADAIDRAPTLLDDLRPLGIEAAYGHALMALSYLRLENDPTTHAQLWWTRATLLMPASTLVNRFAELNSLWQTEALGESPRPFDPVTPL